MKKKLLHKIAAKHGYKSNEDFYADFPDEESYIKKFGIGGVLPEGNNATTIQRKDIMSLPGAINQTLDSNKNNGLTSVTNPYDFSYKMGVTTLNPDQWKKLSVDQSSNIYHQALNKAGFSQINPNKFTSNGQSDGFAGGGNIAQTIQQVTGALAPVAALIPGFGQVASLALKATSMISGQFIKPEKEKSLGTQENLSVNQGLYGYAKGGNLGGRRKYFSGGNPYEVEKNEVVLGNPKLEKEHSKSSVGTIAGGNYHEQGGTDGQGGDFVISDRYGMDGSYKKNNPDSLAKKAQPIMRSIANIEKRRGDAIDNTTKQILTSKIQMIKKINEGYLQMEKDKRAQKFAGGGNLKYYGGGTEPGNPNGPYDWENTGTGYADNLMTGIPGLEDPSLFGNTSYDPSPNTVKTGFNLVPDSYTADAWKSDAFTGEETNVPTGQKTNASKVGGLTGLDIAGMGIVGLGAGLQVFNTIKEKRENDKLPNENFYKGVGDRAENTFNDSLNVLSRQKNQSYKDINESFSPILTSQQGNSINVDRAIKANAYTQKAKAIGNSNLAYDGELAKGKQGLAGMQFQNDSLKAQGDFKVLEQSKMDIAQYFTNLGVNISDASQFAAQAVAIAQRGKTNQQILSLLKDNFPNFTLSQISDLFQVIHKD